MHSPSRAPFKLLQDGGVVSGRSNSLSWTWTLVSFSVHVIYGVHLSYWAYNIRFVAWCNCAWLASIRTPAWLSWKKREQKQDEKQQEKQVLNRQQMLAMDVRQTRSR